MRHEDAREDVVQSRLNALKEAQSRLRLHDEVFKTELGYFGSITSQEVEAIIPHLNLPEDGNVEVVDLGSGTGNFLLELVARQSQIRSLTGIEYDAALQAKSIQVLEEVSRSSQGVGGPLVRPGQVEFLKGDFFAEKFKEKVRSADRIFYYLSSSDQEEELTILIGQNLQKPGARFVVFGDNANPFPGLVTDYGFARAKQDLVTVFSR